MTLFFMAPLFCAQLLIFIHVLICLLILKEKSTFKLMWHIYEEFRYTFSEKLKIAVSSCLRRNFECPRQIHDDVIYKKFLSGSDRRRKTLMSDFWVRRDVQVHPFASTLNMRFRNFCRKWRNFVSRFHAIFPSFSTFFEQVFIFLSYSMFLFPLLFLSSRNHNNYFVKNHVSPNKLSQMKFFGKFDFFFVTIVCSIFNWNWIAVFLFYLDWFGVFCFI